METWLRKISLHTLLVKRLNVSIVVAKRYVDDLAAGEVIELEIHSDIALDFEKELGEVGLICRTEPEALDLARRNSRQCGTCSGREFR